MVCDRCKLAVNSIFEEAGFKPLKIELGAIELEQKLPEKEKNEINLALEKIGFSFIDDKKSRLIEQVKKEIIELVQNGNLDIKTNLSDYLSEKLNQDYSSLSNLFSAVEGITIEKYFIANKIEKAKELIVYDELNLSEIAFQLNYSSVAHLSNQFKKVTGLTPSYFKSLKETKRKSLHSL